MTFRLLSNGKGVITSRQPVVEKENITLLFIEAPEKATAVISSHSGTYYRELQNSRCNLQVKQLDGNISVAIVNNDKTAKVRRYFCEGLKANKLDDGSAILSPDDSNLPEEFAKLRIETDELRTAHRLLEQKYNELEEKLETYMSGHNLI